MSRTKVTVVNKTGWRTSDLRPIVVRAVRQVERMTGSVKWRVTVTLYPDSSGDSCWGRAHINSGYCWVNVNGALSGIRQFGFGKRIPDVPSDRGKVRLANTIAHEVARCFGLTHDDMRESYRELTWKGQWFEKFKWAVDMPLRRKPVKVKAVKPAGLELAEIRHRHAVTKMAEWVRKEKAAHNRMAGWRKKVKYYERRMAALRKDSQ